MQWTALEWGCGTTRVEIGLNVYDNLRITIEETRFGRG
jgi:hypothetical protein